MRSCEDLRSARRFTCFLIAALSGCGQHQAGKVLPAHSSAPPPPLAHLATSSLTPRYLSVLSKPLTCIAKIASCTAGKANSLVCTKIIAGTEPPVELLQDGLGSREFVLRDISEAVTYAPQRLPALISP